MPYKNPEEAKEYQKQYRERTKDKKKEYNQQYFQANKEKLREDNNEAAKRYYVNHRDEILERTREKQQTQEWKAYRSQYYEENKESILKAQREEYQTNPELRKKRKENLQRLRQERREWLASYKSQFSCPCGEADPACLDFHHRDPNEKEAQVTRLVKQAASMERILAEIEKCDLLCSNCHRKLHARQRKDCDVS